MATNHQLNHIKKDFLHSHMWRFSLKYPLFWHCKFLQIVDVNGKIGDIVDSDVVDSDSVCV